MQKLIPVLLAVALLLAGCGNIFEDEYHYSAPFAYNIGGGSGNATEIGNYNMLKSALLDLIGRHEEEAVFRFSRYNGSVTDDLAAASLEIRSTNPLGAYAVESMTYDTSRIVSYYLAEVRVNYKRTAEEIQNVRWVTSLTELEEFMRETVTGYQNEAVLRASSAQVDEAYISGLVESLYLNDPVNVAAEPRAEISCYPIEGPNRIYDVRLSYGGAQAPRLRAMSRRLTEQVEALAERIAAEDAPRTALEAAEQVYAYLEDPTASTVGSTAYDALIRRAADSKGVALAYKAVCSALGLECMVIRGQLGDMGAEEHWWNILRLEGAYYHADVSRFGEGRAQAFLLDDAGLWGRYLWDAESYPECTGNLRYTDLVPEIVQPDLPNPPEGIPEEEIIPTESPVVETEEPAEEPDVVEADPDAGQEEPAETPEEPQEPVP